MGQEVSIYITVASTGWALTFANQMGCMESGFRTCIAAASCVLYNILRSRARPVPQPWWFYRAWDRGTNGNSVSFEHLDSEPHLQFECSDDHARFGYNWKCSYAPCFRAAILNQTRQKVTGDQSWPRLFGSSLYACLGKLFMPPWLASANHLAAWP